MLTEELYAQRLQKLIDLHLSTDCLMKVLICEYEDINILICREHCRTLSCYHLGKGGYVFGSICLFVYLFVRTITQNIIN